MSSEINTLGYYLKRISEKNRQTRDYTLNSLINAIIETIALFPIYRTYINSPKINDRDRRYIELTIAKAKRKNPAINETIFSFLKDVLLNNCPEYISDTDRQEWLDFVMRFQQITGPVMAKGVEDTSFYIYNRLVSLNEVGGSPDRFGTPLETFHGQNTERIKSWPYSMIATSTHDTKRSEDVRARINVLSEMPERWKACLAKWGRLNKKNRIITEDRTVPDRNEEYLFYQTLIGVWPIKPTEPAENENELLKKRIKEYMLKAIREAKVNTSWINPNSVYEDTLFRFVDAVLKDTPNNLFLKDFKAFQSEISQYGLYNSLSQTLLKITSPGIPDFYQGTELYDFSLVDPDNRRQVHYENRMNLLQKLKKQDASTSGCKLGRELTLKKEDGLIKLYLIYKALNYRKENREIFENGDYVPLDVTGAKGYNVCAFARVEKNAHFLTIVPRFITQLIPQPGDLPFGKEVWADTFVIIPFGRTDSKYRNIFTGEIIPATNHKDTNGLFLSEIFINFPAALLEVCSD